MSDTTLEKSPMGEKGMDSDAMEQDCDLLKVTSCSNLVVEGGESSELEKGRGRRFPQ